MIKVGIVGLGRSGWELHTESGLERHCLAQSRWIPGYSQ